MQRVVFTCLLSYIMWYIAHMLLAQRAYTCSLMWLSVVQIINANSATADLAVPLVSSTEHSKHTVAAPEGLCF